MRQASELREAIVFGMEVASFGKKALDLASLYPQAKLLVFAPEPWKMLATKSVAVNDKMTYVLAKWRDEYVIVAEKRLGELQLRTGHTFKKLLVFEGETLCEILL